jgi:hypothetical protein
LSIWNNGKRLSPVGGQGDNFLSPKKLQNGYNFTMNWKIVVKTAKNYKNTAF